MFQVGKKVESYPMLGTRTWVGAQMANGCSRVGCYRKRVQQEP